METYNANPEIQNLYSELQKASNPIKEKIYALRAKDDAEFKKRKEAEFDLIKGKSFYGNGSTWGGYSNLFVLVKPISCTDFSIYNSCTIMELMIRFKDKKMESITFKKEQHRVDIFQTHYKPLTTEMFKKFKDSMDEDLKNALSIFDINI